MFAVAIPHWGPFGDPRHAAALAHRAESAGWDGYSTWGGFASADDPPPTYDPWVALAAVAAATSRIRIGTCIAPLPRIHLTSSRASTCSRRGG